MKRRDYKRWAAFLFFIGLAAFGSRGGARVGAFSGGPPNGLTGAPGETTCAVSGCHGNSQTNVGGGMFTITGLPAAGYAPNQDVDLTLRLSQTNRGAFGFSMTAVDGAGNRAGQLILLEPTRTQKAEENIVGKTREYVSHLLAGIAPTAADVGSWRIRWRAPAQSIGPVTFYAAGNAANGNGAVGGDFIYTASATLGPQTAPTALSSVSAASFAAQAPLAPEAIAAAFGSGLASSFVVVTGTPLPVQLGGTQILVRDAQGTERAAPLFFASPGQINYLVPAGSAAGAATVTARRDGFDVAQGTIQIAAVAPAIFSANANGRGAAAAVLFRRKANGQESFEPVAQYDAATQQVEPLPIDLGPESDQVFLILYGTGFRNRSALAAVACTIGGTAVETLFAGAQGALTGLDQANLRLPRTLAGRGLLEVAFAADGRAANRVAIQVK